MVQAQAETTRREIVWIDTLSKAPASIQQEIPRTEVAWINALSKAPASIQAETHTPT
jgi:hypothetical protein